MMFMNRWDVDNALEPKKTMTYQELIEHENGG